MNITPKDRREFLGGYIYIIDNVQWIFVGLLLFYLVGGMLCTCMFICLHWRHIDIGIHGLQQTIEDNIGQELYLTCFWKQHKHILASAGSFPAMGSMSDATSKRNKPAVLRWSGTKRKITGRRCQDSKSNSFHKNEKKSNSFHKAQSSETFLHIELLVFFWVSLFPRNSHQVQVQRFTVQSAPWKKIGYVTGGPVLDTGHIIRFANHNRWKRHRCRDVLDGSLQ